MVIKTFVKVQLVLLPQLIHKSAAVLKTFLLHLNLGFKPMPCEDELIGPGHLNDGDVWCGNLGLPSYLQVDLNSTYVICAVQTQGNSSSFVEEYRVEFSNNGSHWDFYQGLTGTKVGFIQEWQKANLTAG